MMSSEADEVEAVLDIENTFYSGVLAFHHEDKLGVHFGRMDNSIERDGATFVDPDGRDNYPALVIFPHAVWEAHDRPNKMIASFRFATGMIPDALASFEGVFLMVQKNDGSQGESEEGSTEEEN
jgi:hypothetical protein